MALTAQSTVNEWLEDPVGGALIRDLMSQRGVPEAMLAPVRSIPLEQVLAGDRRRSGREGVWLSSASGHFGDLTVFDVPAARESHGVEHATVVRHQQHCSVKGLHRLFELLDCGQVEVVGGFVED